VVWLATIALLLIAMWPASLGGWTSYVIVHGQSMNPTYASGDLVVVREEAHYRIGDIIAYKIPKPSPIAGHMVIHRVKEITPKGILTQGDNRETEDEWYLHHDDIVGKARVHLALPGGEAFWGYVPWAFCLLIGVGIMWMMWPGRPTEDEIVEDREQRAEVARAAKHTYSRRERRAQRSARAEIAQMVTGAVALVGAVVILIVSLH
jgi:signal peptidase